jgi:hypothetical protein
MVGASGIAALGAGAGGGIRGKQGWLEGESRGRSRGTAGGRGPEFFAANIVFMKQMLCYDAIVRRLGV